MPTSQIRASQTVAEEENGETKALSCNFRFPAEPLVMGALIA